MADKLVTFVLMTCGEPTEAECLAAVAPFRDEIEWFEVRNVSPQAAALNRMIAGVATDFFVPLDADIILDHDAWTRVMQAVRKHWHDPRWHSILFPLWDTLTERKILALKVLRTKVAKENLFAESATPDVEHYARLTAAGYTCVHDYLTQRPIGRHVVRGQHFCYHKYRDVYQTYRVHGREWDGGVFLGGRDLRSRAKAHFDYFLRKWAATGDRDYLFCIAGLADGVTAPARDRSKSLAEVGLFEDDPEAGVGFFLEWYAAGQPRETGAMIF